MTTYPKVRWVLVGDDGDCDPHLYQECGRRFPGRVAVVALRQVVGPDRLGRTLDLPDDAAPVVRAPNGEELLPLLQEIVGLQRPAGTDQQNWLLEAPARGNAASQLRPWTSGNAVDALVHGCTYFPALAAALDGTRTGDVVLLAGWGGDADQLLTSAGLTLGQALTGAVARGVVLWGLLWRSHIEWLGYKAKANRVLAAEVNAAGGQVLLDQRIRPLGSHHQKLVVLRHPTGLQADVAFLGGLDLAHGRRDNADHFGDAQSVRYAAVYGDTPAWHDVQVAIRGPAVRDAEEVFRERWDDAAALTRMPWHVIPDRLRRLDRTAEPMPAALPDPPSAGSCTVQILRTYPRRFPRYPYAPRGERSIARAYAKALSRARRLIYVEDQYLWSVDVARVFATALKRAPRLQLIAVTPRYPDQEGPAYLNSPRLGRAEAFAMVHNAGGDRVQIFDVENLQGRPVYVHAKVCVIDDVWAAVGSGNFNVRSWTHDSELTAAVLDEMRDTRPPADPGGLGDGARRFARELRLELMREHLGLTDDSALLDPGKAAATARASAAALDAWHAGGCRGARPPGRLRAHPTRAGNRWNGWLTGPLYRLVLDPDGRPLGMRVRRTF